MALERVQRDRASRRGLTLLCLIALGSWACTLLLEPDPIPPFDAGAHRDSDIDEGNDADTRNDADRDTDPDEPETTPLDADSDHDTCTGRCGGACGGCSAAVEVCNADGFCVPKGMGVEVRISAGVFAMGSPLSEAYRRDVEVLHLVQLTHDFAILSTEVTQAEYLNLIGNNPSYYSEDGEGEPCGELCPVENLTWHEAASFCNQLSGDRYDHCYVCGRTGAGLRCELNSAYPTLYECPGYRLPTEAEWEYAARAGTTTATYAGDLISNNDCTEPAIGPIAWVDCNNLENNNHPVGLKVPNAWGLYDMLGNVYELIHDGYGEYSSLGDLSATMIDPLQREVGEQGVVIRGGSAGHGSWRARSAYRNYCTPEDTNGRVGFRYVRTLF